jgi:hypothetical protein
MPRRKAGATNIVSGHYALRVRNGRCFCTATLKWRMKFTLRRKNSGGSTGRELDDQGAGSRMATRCERLLSNFTSPTERPYGDSIGRM